MKAPDKIYVREFAEGLNQMWSSIIATKTSAIAQHEYIRKEALLEWANNWKHLGQTDDFMYAIEVLIQHLNSM